MKLDIDKRRMKNEKRDLKNKLRKAKVNQDQLTAISYLKIRASPCAKKSFTICNTRNQILRV